jgi:hypothetical protein
MKAMNRNLALTGSLGLGASLLGASLMYIFDPVVGRYRRALVADKITLFGHKAADGIEVKSRTLKNRALGLVARRGA